MDLVKSRTVQLSVEDKTRKNEEDKKCINESLLTYIQSSEK